MQRIVRNLNANNVKLFCGIIGNENRSFMTGLVNPKQDMDLKGALSNMKEVVDANDSDHEDVWSELDYELGHHRNVRHEENTTKVKRLENVRKFLMKKEIDKVPKSTSRNITSNINGEKLSSCTGRNVFKIIPLTKTNTVLSTSPLTSPASQTVNSISVRGRGGTISDPRINITRNICYSAQRQNVWQQNPSAYLSDRAQADLVKFAKVRSWVPTITQQRPSQSSFQFSVMSYNILAQNLLTSHLYLYRDSPDHVLEWHYRWQGIKREILDIQPDIVCLQEVQFKNPNHFTLHFEPFFDSLGYKYCVKTRTGNKEDGCVIFFKEDMFSLDDMSSIEYRIDRVKLLDRDNVGLVCRLIPRTSPSTPLVIGNTHLLYNPKRSDIRLSQAALLLAELDRMARTSSGSYLPTILTGDFNSDPISPVVQLLSTGSFHYGGQMCGNRAMPGKLLPDTLGLSDSCQWQVELQQRGLGEQVVLGTGGFKHKFGFQSVHSAGMGVTTFQNRWTMVDYIMHSTNKDCMMDSQLRVVAKLALPSEHDMQNSSKFPSYICPSDHLPLVAQFSIDS